MLKKISAKLYLQSKIIAILIVMILVNITAFDCACLNVSDRVIYKGFKLDNYSFKVFHNSSLLFDDAVMLISGPKKSSIIWKKDKKFGIWVNSESKFIPYYNSVLHLYTTNSLKEITYDYNIKFLNLDVFDYENEDNLYQVFIQNQFLNDFYKNQESAFIIDNNSIVKEVDLPIQVPIGVYKIHLYLFKEKSLIYSGQTEFEIRNNNLFYKIDRVATKHPILYAFIAIIIALLLGWKAAFFFRKRIR